LFADALEAGSKVNEPRKRKRASKDGTPDLPVVPVSTPVLAPISTPVSTPVSAPTLSPLAVKPEPVESPAQISPTALKPMFKVTIVMTYFENVFT